MRKIHVVIIVICVLIALIIAGVFIFKNWEWENDDWLYVSSGDEIIEEMIFNDVPKSHPESEYILYLTQREIMSANDDGDFYPNREVTLGEFFEILLRASMPRLDFENMSGEDYIEKLVDTKIIKGGEVTTENLDSSLTNYQVAVLLAKVDMKIRNNDQMLTSLDFIDIKNIDEIGQTLIGHSVARGFFNLGDSQYFRPFNTLSRAKVAEIIYLFINK